MPDHYCVDGGAGLDGCPHSNRIVFNDPAWWHDALKADQRRALQKGSPVMADRIRKMLSTPAPARTKARLALPTPTPAMTILKEVTQVGIRSRTS